MVAKSIAKIYTNIHKPTDYYSQEHIRPIGNGSQLILKSASDASGTRREDMTVNQAVPVLAKK